MGTSLSMCGRDDEAAAGGGCCDAGAEGEHDATGEVEATNVELLMVRPNLVDLLPLQVRSCSWPCWHCAAHVQHPRA